MKNGRFSDAQIMAVLKQAEGGVPRARNEQREFLQMAGQVWRHGCVLDFRDEGYGENRRLKRMYAEMSMQNDLLKEALGKKR